MIVFLYNCALLLTLLAGAPYWLLRLLRANDSDGLRQRLFGAPARLNGPPGAIWVHAVSVGEALAVSRLIAELATRSPEHRIVISTTTRTGQALARQRFGGGRCFYFPLDFPWAVARTLRVLRPSLLLLAESELWPNLLRQCARAGVPVLVVNARISNHSQPRYLRLRRLWRPFLATLTRVLAQSEEDARRFVAIGVPAERVRVGGNLKFEVRAPSESPLLGLLRQHLPHRARVLVCGSTLEGEETMLLDAWDGVQSRIPPSVMILAPRHPERFPRVADLLRQRSVPYLARSRWASAPAPISPGAVFLLDSIGELASTYAVGALAFVGGSLVPAGGHNPLEPAQFAVPVLMGPYFENFRGVIELLQAHDAIALTTPGALAADLAALLGSPERAQAIGKRGQAVFEREAGATERAVQAALQLLTEARERP